jgi:hypothetical protein
MWRSFAVCTEQSANLRRVPHQVERSETLPLQIEASSLQWFGKASMRLVTSRPVNLRRQPWSLLAKASNPSACTLLANVLLGTPSIRAACA